MGTNYVQRLREQGRRDPAKWRRKREAKQLENLKRAWIEANEVMQAEFLAWIGWEAPANANVLEKPPQSVVSSRDAWPSQSPAISASSS